MVVRLLRCAAVSAALALTLAACGGTATDAKTGASGGTTNSQAPAASVKVGDTGDLGPLSKTWNEAMMKAGAAKVTMTTGGATGKEGMETSGVVDLAKGSMKLTGAIEGKPTEFILVDKVLYIGGDAFKALTGGKKFLKIDGKGDDMMNKLMGPMLEQLGSAANLAKMLEGFNGLKAKVTAVEGDNVTWETDIAGAEMTELMKKLMGSMASTLPTPTSTAQMPSMKILQTIGKDNLPVKVVSTSTINGTESTQTVTYSDWGTTATITAPPASEIGVFTMPKS